jgi:hypothetical protein
MMLVAKAIYEKFLAIVVNDHVFSADERMAGMGPLSEARTKAIAAGRQIDARAPRLQRLSGKGGHVEGPAFARRRIFRNVTLLDHVASVTRGALVLGEFDLRGAGYSDDGGLVSRLAIVAATAFLHDADKMLEKSRLDDLTVADIDLLIGRYGVDKFLAAHGVRLGGAELLPRIHNAETGRHGRILPGASLLSVEAVKDCAYVRLADRLDGAFLQTEPDPRAKGDRPFGIDGVVAELARFEDLRSDVLHSWRALRLSSPHTPFLLDALQGGFAVEVAELAGMPPLIEVHHDGELLLVAPEAVFDRALDGAMGRMGRALRRGLRVDVNTRGARDILDGGATVEDLTSCLRQDRSLAAKALFVHVNVISAHKSDFVADFDRAGFGPALPDMTKLAGKQHCVCWPVRDDDTAGRNETRTRAATIAVAMACPVPDDRTLARQTPGPDAREAELVTLLQDQGHPAPAWVTEVQHQLSRWTLLAAWAAAIADSAFDLEEGLDELLALWLVGSDDRAGVYAKIGDPGAALAAAAAGWIMAASGRRFVPGNEALPGRCHFTALPVEKTGEIDSKTGLYGLNVSAFSGREGRPEDHSSTKASTLVAPPAMAEHRLRSLLNPRSTEGDVPAYVSSPTSSGLFASLVSGTEASVTRFGLFDMARLEIKPGAPCFVDVENFAARVAIGRYDALPTRLVKSGQAPGLVSIAKLVVDAARRTGRPIHVFRGLPSPSNAFVVLEFLPPVIVDALGGWEFRLEELERVSQTLRMIEEIAETNGLGLDLALAYAHPRTRFSAACETLAAIARLDRDRQDKLTGLKMTLTNQARTLMSTADANDSAVIDFARAMARVQIAPGRDASNNELEFGLRIALAAVEGARKQGQTSDESFIYAIAGELAIEFERSQRISWRGKENGLSFPRRAAQAAAEIFVEKVWKGAYGSVSPAGRVRRTTHAIYRVAFETASYEKRPSVSDNTQALSEHTPA